MELEEVLERVRRVAVVGRDLGPEGATGGRLLSAISPLILTLLWAKMPYPHQVWVPVMPSMRLRAAAVFSSVTQ